MTPVGGSPRRRQIDTLSFEGAIHAIEQIKGGQ